MDNNTDYNITLEKLNHDLVTNIYLPIIYLLVFYMLLGVIGNSVVLYIYLVKYRNYGESRFYIPPLAAIDLVTCIVNCLILISWVSSPIKHGTDIECKIKSFLCMTSIMASIIILLLIAVDRYLKICRSFGKQIDLRWKKRSIGLTIIAAMILSLPFLVFNGAVEHTYPGTNVTARNCLEVDYGVPEACMFFYGLYLLIVIAELIAMSVLYFCICRRILNSKHFKAHYEGEDSSHSPDKLTNSSNFDAESTKLNGDTRSIDTTVRYNPHTGDTRSIDTTARYTGSPHASRKNSLGPSQSISINTLQRSMSHVKKIPRSRLTIMFLLITIVFAISFIPRVVIMVLESMGDNFSGISKGLAIFLEFLKTVYIANNFTNPFFYSCLDKKFQLELRKLFCSSIAKRSRKSFARVSTMLYNRVGGNRR